MIDRLATLVDGKIGKSITLETVGYIGPFEVTYLIIATGACKLDYQVRVPALFPVSYSMSFLDELSCSTM
jgi:hypothetical protein